VTTIERADFDLGEEPVVPPRDEDDSLVGDSMSGSLWTGVSRVTGFVRATAIAGILGATYLGNTFQALNSLPNLVYYQLLAGSLFASVLVPVLVRHLKQGDERRTHEILCGFFGTMLTLAAAAGVLLFAGGWVVLQLMAAGVSDPHVAGAQRHVGLIMLALFVPQVALYVVAGVGAAAMNAKRRFALAAGAPAAENVVIVAFLVIAVLMFGSETNITKVTDGEAFVLGLGATLAVVCHASLEWWGARRTGMALVPKRAWRDPDVRVIVRRMGPALAFTGLAFLQVIAFLIAANRVAGGVVALQLALNFFYLPLALVAWPIARALLPQLARRTAENRPELFTSDLRRALSLASFVVIPITVVYMTLSFPLARVVAFGKLSGSGVHLLAWSLLAIAPGILAETWFILGTYTSYAREDMRTPIVPMAISVGVTILGIIAVLPIGGRDYVPLIGVALSVGNVAGAARLWYVLRRQLPRPDEDGAETESPTPWLRGTVARSVTVSLLMILPGWLTAKAIDRLWVGKLDDILALSTAGLVCLLVFFVGHLVLRSPELAWMRSSLFERRGRRNAAVAE
jgi:putative peptidoglycan lipid II flippase